jgi:hypothetical protein
VALAVSGGAACPVTASVPVAVALSVKDIIPLPWLLTVTVQVKVHVAPGSRVFVLPSELLTNVADPHNEPVTCTPVIPTVPVFCSKYVNVRVTQCPLG